MISKQFYRKFGYKELILKDTVVKSQNLTKNNFDLKKIELFIPVFDRNRLLSKKRSKLSKVLFLYFLYQLLFDKSIRIFFKNTLGKPRKILKKVSSGDYGYDVLGFFIILKKNSIYQFIDQFSYDSFFISFFGFQFNSYRNFIFRIAKDKKKDYFLCKFDLKSFFNFNIFNEVLKDLNNSNLNPLSLKVFYNTISVSSKINSLRFLQFPFKFKKFVKKK